MKYKFDHIYEANQWRAEYFDAACRIVRGDVYRWTVVNNREVYLPVYEGRSWFAREVSKYPLHPAVDAMMRVYKPDQWQTLLLEWPHKAATDPSRLAYTRDERSGEQDRQVVTSIGKYLRRHFQYAPDDLIRDIVAKHTYSGGIHYTNSLDEMVNAVIEGPSSCMSKSFDILCADNVRRHPYAVYDPSLGWGMVIRQDGDDILGRCLVWHDPDDADGKMFVRSYKRERDASAHSGADEAIEQWLRDNGYEKHRAWPSGTPIKEYRLRHEDGWLMPYIDGGAQAVCESDFTIDSSGEIRATETSGIADCGDSTCEDCGRRYNSEDDGAILAGVYEDCCICPSCANDFTWARGRRRNEYYMRDSEVVWVNGDAYDCDYLADNDIVELANGDYAHRDDAVWVESEDAYYHCDDDDICYAEDTERYELREDCWQCEESNNWYTNDTDYVEIDGDKYHPDHAPEPEDEDEDEDETATTADTTSTN